MDQLIEITTVPIQIEMKTSHAKLECAQGTAEMEISRGQDGVSIKSKPIRLNMDTFESRGSRPPVAVRGPEQTTYQASAAAFSQPGELTMKTTLGDEVFAKLADTGVDFVPETGTGVELDPAELNIRYEMDKLNFDWKIGQSGFKFTPGDIEVTITQRPEVVIKYVGGPLYVPPSADPDYEPVDVKA